MSRQLDVDTMADLRAATRSPRPGMPPARSTSTRSSTTPRTPSLNTCAPRPRSNPLHSYGYWGVMARVPSDATALAHRARPIMATVGAVYDSAD